MADKLTRQKDVLKSTLSTYLEATTNSSYLAYFEGSPTYLVYYQLDNSATLQDGALETVHSLVGANTPNKYKRIYDLPVYGVDALDVQNELNERGLQAIVNGEILILPDSIRPYPGDFFTFSYEGLEDHLFRINDVQYDKLSPRKYFKCQYSLFQNNADEILNNISEDYEATYSEGTDKTSPGVSIVKSSDAAAEEQTKNLVNSLIERYTSLFYNDDMDTFVCYDGTNRAGTLENDNAARKETGEYYYWCPYLQHFLHETKALTGYTNEILTEIYVMDINEIDNGNIYSEEAYRNSIFRNIQIQNPDVTFDTNFFCSTDYNLKMTRNLPFFMSPLNYRLLSPIVKTGSPTDVMAYRNAFPIFFGSPKLTLKDVDKYHKVHIMDDLHITRIEPYIKAGELIYECRRIDIEPTKLCLAVNMSDENGEYLEIQDASVERLFKSEVKPPLPGMELFQIIKDYLNNEFKLTEDILKKLNELYYKPSIQNYILIPMVIYILKQSLAK